MDNLVDMLIAHEGIELKPYLCPAGRLTIGVGRNIQDLGITREEAIYLLRNDLARVESELYGRFTWFAFLSSNRKNALIDMCFNLGITRFLTFKRMIEAFKEGNYSKAANEMLNSKWADQVGDRAVDLSDMILRG